MRLCMEFKELISRTALVLALFSMTNMGAVLPSFDEDDHGSISIRNRPDRPDRPDRDEMPDWKPASAIPLAEPVKPADNGAAAEAINSGYINPKTLLTSGVIAASIFGGTYLLNKKTNIGSQLKTKAQSVRSKLSDWLNRPLTKLDTYIAGGLTSAGYYAYRTNLPARVFNAGIALKDTAVQTATSTYEKAKAFLSQVTISKPVLGASCAMAITGLLCVAYKRFTGETKYIQAYRKFDNSLRTNLLTLSSEYPKFIELYGEAESNPRCLLEGQEFENAPIIKYLTSVQIKLLKEAIALFDQEKK